MGTRPVLSPESCAWPAVADACSAAAPAAPTPSVNLTCHTRTAAVPGPDHQHHPSCPSPDMMCRLSVPPRNMAVSLAATALGLLMHTAGSACARWRNSCAAGSIAAAEADIARFRCCCCCCCGAPRPGHEDVACLAALPNVPTPRGSARADDGGTSKPHVWERRSWPRINNDNDCSWEDIRS